MSNKLTPDEIAELRKKENSNVLRKYGMQKGDTTARTIKPTVPISTGERGKLIQFPASSTAATPDTTGVSGNQGEGTDVEAELNKP